MAVSMAINEELNGIELYFDSIPEKSVRENLKANRFRFSRYKKCWYTKQSDKAFKVAEMLTSGEVLQASKPTKTTQTSNTTKKRNNTLSLWDACQWSGMEVNGEQDTKQIAKEIRQHLRKRFPMCKFSVRTDGNAYYSAIRFYIVSSPYEKDSAYLKAVREYCTNLMNAYHKCYSPSDPYTDYAGHYNFSGHVEIDWEYKQTDQTEAIKNDMTDFDGKLAEFEKQQEEERRKRVEENIKRMEQEREEDKRLREEQSRQVEHIYNSVNVKPLEDDEQYYIIGSEFANLNKNNTLDQYKEEVKNNEYTLQDVQIEKEIHFSDETALNNFSNLLLCDFDFLQGTGGTNTDDNRLTSMTDYRHMDEEERETVKFYLSGVAVYYNNTLQFVIDTQGYSYSRYVGLTDNATIQKSLTTPQVIEEEELAALKQQAERLTDMSTEVITGLSIINTWQDEAWNEYKEGMKESLKSYNMKLTKLIIQQVETEELKTAMYKLLIEVDGIQEQFKEANLKQGDKLTLFHIGSMGMMSEKRITFDSVEYKPYAQYENAVRLEFKPERKRKLYYNYYHSDLLVFEGWHTLPDEVLNTVEHRNDMTITQSKYHSTDKKQYDAILSYFDSQGIRPIINTHRPQF